ncbi:CU044_2847 family protein [Leptolyngbya sp. CCNP1308]|uniref:CU044_2847 family protein n=1 Tax=Leptolyngbya sp. CCNP1308 TaxID=3110255 RepID=UPI002B1EFA26|nr:CU044_2847 family protein [Leptolyngbya sp. CCNP1308]MEA5447002.1 CU044_2847 family protein [Leptolyngbya sp. CCNP1308]
MTQLVPITLDDNTVIYIEATDTVTPPAAMPPMAPPAMPPSAPPAPWPHSEETTRTAKGASEQVVKSFQAMQGTIRAYTVYTLDAFRHMAGANVNKVTLEFGIKVAGEAGVPYITKGTAESNLKITVECSFPDTTDGGSARRLNPESRGG